MKELKFKQLLDLEWTVKKATIPAQRQYDEYYKDYGKEELLTKIAYSDLKELREAQKTMEQVMNTLRDNDLYSND
jgi:hypothetical protein